MEPARTSLTPVRVDNFINLFRGRGDVYGSWDGGCVKQMLTNDKFVAHLQGTHPIGVYPLFPYKSNWYCVWGCSDIDVDDLDAARNIQAAFKVKNIPSWVERTRKGYHVWVFSNSLVTGAVMRRAFLAAHQAINYPAKEVNPKQENPGNGYGNYVRLPYPGIGHSFPENRYMLDDDDKPMDFEQFLVEAHANRASHAQLEEVASLWKPPKVSVLTASGVTDNIRSILHKVGAVPYIIWRDGPLDGADRSSTLFRLACKLRDSNISPEEALTVVRSADNRWGKFHLRSDGDMELIKCIERAYNISYREADNGDR